MIQDDLIDLGLRKTVEISGTDLRVQTVQVLEIERADVRRPLIRFHVFLGIGIWIISIAGEIVVHVDHKTRHDAVHQDIVEGDVFDVGLVASAPLGLDAQSPVGVLEDTSGDFDVPDAAA